MTAVRQNHGLEVRDGGLRCAPRPAHRGVPTGSPPAPVAAKLFQKHVDTPGSAIAFLKATRLGELHGCD